MRRLAAVLAFLAMSAALAQSLCDLQQPQAAHHEDCCASLEGGTVAPSTAAVPASSSTTALPGAAAPLAVPRAADARLAAVFPDRPPLSRRYHARSARILT